MSLQSFKYAINGIKKTFNSEHNYRLMIGFLVLIVIISFFLKISRIEWAIILLCCGGVIALEMVNTAIECVIDMITAEYHPVAEKAKDIAAGLVLVFIIFTIIIGLIIFIPYII